MTATEEFISIIAAAIFWSLTILIVGVFVAAELVKF